MEKRKWQFLLILAVILLTVYNILPTLFYYSKPLKKPISPAVAEKISASIVDRISVLEDETKEWIRSYCHLIHIKPKTVSIDSEHPQTVVVSFEKKEEADRLRTSLPRAGSLIPFGPAQLSLSFQEEDAKEVRVLRKIPIRLKKEDFSYLSKNDSKILHDRMQQIAFVLGGSTETSLLVNSLERGNVSFSLIEALASQVHAIAETFEEGHPLAARFAARFTQGRIIHKKEAIEHLIQAFGQARDATRREKNRLQTLKDEGTEHRLHALERKEENLFAAEHYLKEHASQFASGKDPWVFSEIGQRLDVSNQLDLSNVHPFFSELLLDLQKERIILKLHPDAIAYRASGQNKEQFEKLIIDELARISSQTLETLAPDSEEISIALHRTPNVSGYLAFNQQRLAQRIVKQLQQSLAIWHPLHPDLAGLEVVDYDTYLSLSEEKKVLSLVVISPLASQNPDFAELKRNSLYIAAKGIGRIAKNYEQFPETQLALHFNDDLQRLGNLLQKEGFLAYRGPAFLNALTEEGDFLFEKPNFTSTILAATREDFLLFGTQKMALIELRDVEQRMITENKIETRIHEDLLQWKDDYHAAQVSLNPHLHFDVPKPTKSVFWQNILLSIRKYFRGDERKIIRWGLDLSGGKSVQIELRDSNRRVVTNDADLKQGINELSQRINKMGVSEVSIRQTGHQIVLDFPSSQAMSASELIKPSTMYFHVVNEKFSLLNPIFANSVNHFLQEIWNEAIVTGKKDPQSINAIAYDHLHSEKGGPCSEAARDLWENGLRLARWNDPDATSALETAVSKIALFRGDDSTEWQGQTHPLLIVFRNWALEGASLQNIHASYDSTKGNFLSFDVRSSYEVGGKKIHPRHDLCAWTSHYSKEKVVGTPLEHISGGKGWRMAVLLNDFIISAPMLDSALKESAMIKGNFSQREVNRLAADLKAGSLTFTPHILCEKNVSPDLGQTDRIKGITGTTLALVLVIGSMVIYYRFAGLIASVAVLFNLLILWAILQNLGATLTLSGLAAIVLTIGMAVDANVLVFERIREEFAHSANLHSAISAGYKKAYSAIIDSNITTLIAALILLNFDAGPIKSFSVNLIIGIISSMFTALFMTRFYFMGWVQKPKNRALKMASWITSTHFDFLKKAKFAFAIAGAIVLIGCPLIFFQRHSIFGMDFTGGYSLNLELENTDGDLAAAVQKALLSAGASSQDFQIQKLHPSHHLRIFLGTAMELPGKPFHGLPIEKDKHLVVKNSRIEWVVDALHKEGLALAPHFLPFLDSSWTAMSGQMSDSMKNHALVGLAASFLGVFFYLSFRFEYKFAAAALICLFHDVFITLGCLGLLHVCGLEIQIDLSTVAALMTIVGYSLNDTIIIFDRIREEMRCNRNQALTDIVNQALNATLSRTTITSGTTLLVLIALLLFGGPSIFGFSFVMALGVFFGTLSSWFIASPLMIFFHKQRATQLQLH